MKYHVITNIDLAVLWSHRVGVYSTHSRTDVTVCGLTIWVLDRPISYLNQFARTWDDQAAYSCECKVLSKFIYRPQNDGSLRLSRLSQELNFGPPARVTCEWKSSNAYFRPALLITWTQKKLWFIIQIKSSTRWNSVVLNKWDNDRMTYLKFLLMNWQVASLDI